MYLFGGIIGVVVEKFLRFFVGQAVDDKHIEPEEKDWDWGEEYKPKEFEAQIAIERKPEICVAILARINAFLSEGGTIPVDLSKRLLDAIEEGDSDSPAGSDDFSCRVLYAKAPLQIRIEHKALGDDPENANTDFVVLTFFSSRELAERIQMEIDRLIGERSKQTL